MTWNSPLACSALLSALILSVPAGAAPRQPAWQPFESLAGEWTGEAAGGSGGSIFRFSLDDTVLIRENWADYPASKDRPALSHKDLMVIFRESPQAPGQAIYFDNEGHVIRYAVSVLPGGAIQFLSHAAPATPRYRLTYTPDGAATLRLRFELAPPGQPDAFKLYIEATLHRKK